MPLKILVMDDDVEVRESLVISMEDEGFDVSQVGSSEEALAWLDENYADLVVVDLRLPGMDGPEFIREASKRYADLKYIVYTGSPEFHIPAELATVPAVSNSIFLKPLSEFEGMFSEIKRLLGE